MMVDAIYPALGTLNGNDHAPEVFLSNARRANVKCMDDF